MNKPVQLIKELRGHIADVQHIEYTEQFGPIRSISDLYSADAGISAILTETFLIFSSPFKKIPR
jgi:hypothetical protein